MPECALGFPMLFLILFATVDCCRYYVACAVLQTGAEAGLNRVREVPDFDLDWRGELPTGGDYLRFVQARTRILDEAESAAASVATKQNQPSAVTLRDITQTDSGLAGSGPAPTYTRSAAALRPGDCADVSGYGTLCNAPDGSGLPFGDLMKAFPIRVVMLAEVSSVVPFVGPYIARGEAFGCRRPNRPAKAGRDPIPGRVNAVPGSHIDSIEQSPGDRAPDARKDEAEAPGSSKCKAAPPASVPAGPLP